MFWVSFMMWNFTPSTELRTRRLEYNFVVLGTLSFADERVGSALAADRCRRSMAWQNDDVVAEREQLRLDAAKQQIAVASREIPAANAAGEEDIAAD
jgi:hypothetical protein